MAAAGDVPALSVAEVQQMLAISPYDPQAIPPLERFVESEVAGAGYSLDANLALLRLYQFEPHRANIGIISKVLITALMQLPRNDFNLCIFLIPERLQALEPISSLTLLGHYLESCNFGAFWNEAAKHRELFKKIPGFEQAIRGYAIQILLRSFKRVPRDTLAEAININGPSLDDFIQQQADANGWNTEESVKGQLVVLPENEDNSATLAKSHAEVISLENAARLFPILS